MRYICFVLLAAVVTAQDGNKRTCVCDSERCKKNIELGIVLDVSNSVWPEYLKKATEFLNNFLEYFTVSQDGTRVALVPYGGNVYKRQAFNLEEYNNIEDVQRTISGVHHLPNQRLYTETGDAIAYMRKAQLNSQHTRTGVRRACIVLTDGNSQDRTKTEKEAKKARDDGIHMFAVGVGSSVNQEELQRIAGEENPTHINHVGSYDELFSVIEPLVKETCSSK